MSSTTPRWQAPFLEALRVSGIQMRAAEAAGVDRVTVYRRRLADPDFDQACRDAMEDAIDLLEAEAVRRARDGVQEDVYHQGVVVGQKLVYSDSLLLGLLKGRRKSVFSDRTEITGASGKPISYTIVTGVPQPEPDNSDLV